MLFAALLAGAAGAIDVTRADSVCSRMNPLAGSLKHCHVRSPPMNSTLGQQGHGRRPTAVILVSGYLGQVWRCAAVRLRAFVSLQRRHGWDVDVVVYTWGTFGPADKEALSSLTADKGELVDPAAVVSHLGAVAVAAEDAAAWQREVHGATVQRHCEQLPAKAYGSSWWDSAI